jgi:hypothetical protein
LEWLGILLGIFISLYQVFVGFGLEYKTPATRRFAYHFSVYAALALLGIIGYGLYHATTTGAFGGVLATLVALPYLSFYTITAWYFYRSDTALWPENETET